MGPISLMGHKTNDAPKIVGSMCLKFGHAKNSATDYTVPVWVQKAFTNKDFCYGHLRSVWVLGP